MFKNRYMKYPAKHNQEACSYIDKANDCNYFIFLQAGHKNRSVAYTHEENKLIRIFNSQLNYNYNFN